MAAKTLGELLRHVDDSPLLHMAASRAVTLSQSPEITERDFDLLRLTVERLESALEHAHVRLYGKPYYLTGDV